MNKDHKERLLQLMGLESGCLSEEEAKEVVVLAPSLDTDEDDLHWDCYCLLLDSGFKGLAEELGKKRPPGYYQASGGF